MAINVLTLNLMIKIFLNSEVLGLDLTRKSIILKKQFRNTLDIVNIKTH